MEKPNPRLVVAKALCKMEKDKAWSNLVLDQALQEHKLGSRDSAFAGALFYGVLERMLTLDACIAPHCSVKLRKLSLPVLTALRMGVYQLLYMDSVPDSAAVSQSVAMAKAMKQHKSTGLVNAVLRSFLRSEKAIPLPQTPLERLSVEYSCPAPLIALWQQAYGEETTLALLVRSLEPPPLYIRVNTTQITPQQLIEQLEALEIRATAEPDLPNCLRLQKIGTVAHLPAFRQGLFHVQDKASQLCVMALGAQPGMRVLDACAAPGGKAFTTAQTMENQGELVAVDLYPQRVALMERRAKEMGVSCIRTMVADMASPQPELGLFQRVLCDVPCSGLGVIGRKPEIKYKPLEEFAEFPNIQYKILENTAQYCQVGGLLLYSTCTLNPAENTGVVERFLKEHSEFAPEPLPKALGEGWNRTFLTQQDTDGFFIALLKRTN